MTEQDRRRIAIDALRKMVESPVQLALNAEGDPTGIQLFQAGVTDEQMKYFRYFPTFEAISLGECPITDAGLVHLADLPRIRYLDLQGTCVTDSGLDHLWGLTSLKDLNLFGCPITDAGLRKLEALSSLRRLTLYEENPNLSDGAIAQLLAAIPGLRILDAAGAEIA